MSDSNEEEILYPRIGDTLTEEGGGKPAKELFADWLTGQWQFYPDAYKRAGDIMVAAIEGESWEDVLILPIVFLYRHFVELKIKDIIIQLDKLGGTKMPVDDFRHQLLPLWSYLKDHLSCIRTEIPDKEMVPALDSLINELSELDPDSFHFRYALDRSRLNAPPLPRSLSMTHFKEVMDKVKSGLDYIEAGIDLEREARIVDGYVD